MVGFDGPVQLAEAMAESLNAHRCYAQNWLEYSFGRPIQPGDTPVLESLAQTSRSDDLSVKEILVALIDSNLFRNRRTQPEEDSE